ncbi:hypothetical protein HYW11_03885 [Candidatus Peregrinibacteria bacterium]|nr:hypothetical protein [Candidatus Peregrinibacteria bacterium]
MFLARHWRQATCIGVALCLALIAVTKAAENKIFLSCTGADGRVVRPFVIDSEDGTRSATFPVTVPGWPALFAVTLPDEDDTSSFDVENGTATVQREGPVLHVAFRNTVGDSDEVRCDVGVAPPEASPLCRLNRDRAIERCADLYAAAHPTCAGEKDAALAKNEAVAAAISLLPPWYVALSSPSFLPALLTSDPTLLEALEDIENTCGEKLRFAVVPELPFGFSGLFSADAFTVYVRNPPHNEPVYAIILHEIRHAKQFCENGKKWPPPGSLCSSEREAMVPLCEFFVTALRDIQDPPALQKFLCSL